MPFSHFRSITRILVSPRVHHSRPLIRPFTTTPLLLAKDTQPQTSHPQRNAQQDRESMNTEANEYAKSGTDSGTAQQDQAAYDPNITDPQHAKKKAGEGQEGNPLDVSPANPEVSQGTSEVEGGLDKKISEGGGGRQGGGDSSGDKYGGGTI